MTATNHAATGAIIGLTVTNPWLVLPLALMSHFICDAIPHYGQGKNAVNSISFARLLHIDVAGCIILVAFLVAMQPAGWLLAVISSFVATSPDLMWLRPYIQSKSGKTIDWTNGWYRKFHAHIQWFERPIGAFVEAVWLGGALIMLMIIVV